MTALKSEFNILGKECEYLLKEGEISDKLYFIESGYALIKASSNEKKVVRHIARPSEFITSIQSFITQTPSKESIIQIDGAKIYYLNYERFSYLISQYLEIERYFNAYIINILFLCQKRINDLMLLNGSQYYEKFIEDNKDIIQDIPQYKIASYLGVKPQSLSRIRSIRKG